MDVKDFLQLYMFEIAYLGTLAYLPFVITLKEVTAVILIVLGVVSTVVLVKHLNVKKVDPAGKVVLISGCDSGFGNACARRLDVYGFTVLAGCLDVESDGAVALKASTSGRMHVVPLDVTDTQSLAECMAAVENKCQGKGLWALINNAGVAAFGDVEFTDIDLFRHVLEVNLFGSIQLTKMCLPYVRKTKGHVINMSGSNGLVSVPGQSAFSISCFGIEAFSDALRLEMRPFGVEVTTIRPGNFIGATGILNKNSCDKLKGNFAKLKDSTDKEILNSYGHNYLDTQFEQLSKLSKSSASSLLSVVETMESAVTHTKPRSRYLVDGGSQMLDAGNMIVYLRQFLPSAIIDHLVLRLYRQETEQNIS